MSEIPSSYDPKQNQGEVYAAPGKVDDLPIVESAELPATGPEIEKAGQDFIDSAESQIKASLAEKFALLCSDTTPRLAEELLKMTDKESLSELSIGFIPTASNHWEFKAFQEHDIKFWTDRGAELDMIELETESEEEILEKIQASDVVVVSGGNTYYLSKWATEKGLGDKLKNWNGVTIGVSAGAILFGTDISTASVCGDIAYGIDLENRQGWGEIGKKIWVHYGKVTKLIGSIIGNTPTGGEDDNLFIRGEDIYLYKNGDVTKLPASNSEASTGEEPNNG